MSRVLIAYDGSDPARSAIRAAAGLFPESEAVVLHVYDRPHGPEKALAAGAFPNEVMSEALQSLAGEAAEQAGTVAEQGRALAADAGLSAESQTAPTARAEWHEITAQAAARAVDLIVCGTRGQGALGRAVLGSVSSSLVHQADRPVLIVPAGRHEVTGPVVVGYDGSEDARSAIATVGRLLPEREVVIVHVWNWPLTNTTTERALLAAPAVRDSGVVEILRETAEEAVREVAEEGRQLAEQHGLRATLELRESSEGTWHALAQAAADADAAAIVAGSRGMGGLKSALLGSVSTALAHRAERPTLIVRPAD